MKRTSPMATAVIVGMVALACDTGSGGLIFRECIGVERYQRIVGEDR